MRVAFVWQGERIEAERIAPGTESIRVGWEEPDVPPTLADQVEASAKRPGWMTMLLPLVGPNAVMTEEVLDAEMVIKKRQIAWAVTRGIRLQKGNPRSAEEPLYTMSLNENLFEPLSPEATLEFEQGDGTPLMAKSGTLPHLWALHNSDAIAVNVFGYWKSRDCSQVAQYMGIPCDGIAGLSFEQKFRILPKGTKPNIDVAIKYRPGSEVDWVGIEAKLTETYPAKRRKLFDEKYFVTGGWWDGLPATRRLAESFRGDGNNTERTKRHLDRGQLIKHILGLRSSCRLRQCDPCRVRLVYLWYNVDSPEARRHQQEVEEFSAVLASDGVAFQAMTWQQLIQRIVNGEMEQHPSYAAYLEHRYLE